MFTFQRWLIIEVGTVINLLLFGVGGCGACVSGLVVRG